MATGLKMPEQTFLIAAVLTEARTGNSAKMETNLLLLDY